MKLSEATHDWQLQAWIDADYLSGYEYKLLTTLRDEGPLHRDRLQETMGEHCIVTPDAPLYVMQQRGQVRRFKRDDREAYEITPAGLEALEEE